jgi:hypothetical protein
MTYDYNRPSRINLVSVFFLLVIVGGVYASVKFVPVYWQGKQVDRELDELKLRAGDFGRLADDVRRSSSEAIVVQAIARIHELGIDDEPDQPVQVWFTPDYGELHARYRVVVAHPANVVKPTVITMERSVEVPR